MKMEIGLAYEMMYRGKKKKGGGGVFVSFMKCDKRRRGNRESTFSGLLGRSVMTCM